MLKYHIWAYSVASQRGWEIGKPQWCFQNFKILSLFQIGKFEKFTYPHQFRSVVLPPLGGFGGLLPGCGFIFIFHVSVTQKRIMCKRKRNSEPKVIDYSTLNYPKTAIDIDLCASPMSEEDESSLRSIFCLKSREKMREIEEKEDCFILGFDPYEITKLSFSISPADSSRDFLITAEKGQVACRDYPHSRHVCIKYPFEKTPHEKYCKLCYCFVCDVAAPCRKWTGTSGHCNAIDNEGWNFERKKMQQL